MENEQDNNKFGKLIASGSQYGNNKFTITEFILYPFDDESPVSMTPLEYINELNKF